MDVVGSEIGQKMRSAIKAKLTELGCYVDDELPDYVMVMVANKRTRAQMDDDLQLFLGDNTEMFVNWLHQVLKKLQEVTITAPLKAAEPEKKKERSKSKEKKEKKDKKDKSKRVESTKKSKKKEKEKSQKKKELKKLHKDKKKSKHEMIRPNIPPLLMNIEKESEPSITDVFAGQILKKHGFIVDIPKEDTQEDKKPAIIENKRPLQIIDPATISQPETAESTSNTPTQTVQSINQSAAQEDPVKEINDIEAKIQGLKQKLAEQLDSMSDDEDFLNIRTEAEELMNDFAEDVLQEISQPTPQPQITPPPTRLRNKSPSPKPMQTIETQSEISKEPQVLPQIELNLPKRPVRDRLGAKQEIKKVTEKATAKRKSPERYTPEREPDIRPFKSAKSRLGEPPEKKRKCSQSEESSDDFESGSKRLTSRVSVLENKPPRLSCASVVRVRPRPRVGAPASSLLLRAVADAHKSLLNKPPKVDNDPPKVKRALVHPMRRVDAQNIVIQVQGDKQTDNQSDTISLGEISDGDDKRTPTVDTVKEEYIPAAITKVIKNTEYVPSQTLDSRTATRTDDALVVETIDIHNTTVDKDKDTQFIVTMDGFNPNAFLAKKLMTEGLLNEDDEILKKVKPKEKREPIIRRNPKETDKERTRENKDLIKENESPEEVLEKPVKEISPQKKRLSDNSITSEESDTQVIIKQENNIVIEKNKTTVSQTQKRDEVTSKKMGEIRKSTESIKDEISEECSPKKRKASPIVFDVDKKEKEEVKERQRERTESASSDNHVIVTTTLNSNKYDTIPPLTQTDRKPPVWCRAFPLCKYGSACAFQHPRCKFAAACTRRGCIYSHAHVKSAVTSPVVASHVVPAANFKTISSAPLPAMCKYYPNCVNPSCHYYHPKPCRYGKACVNKLECNFYHNDVPGGKWKYPA